MRAYSTDIYGRFRRPVFHIVVFFVEEPLSVERQLMRGRKAIAHNRTNCICVASHAFGSALYARRCFWSVRVQQTGVGELVEVRSTDVDEKLARSANLSIDCP